MGSNKNFKERHGGRRPGKIDASLDAMLQSVEWGEYKLGDLFEVKSNPQLDKNNFSFSEYGEYPYFTRTIYNNGILGNVDYLDEEHKIAGECIAVGMLSMQFFYMQKDFYAGQFTKRFIPKDFVLNPCRAQFINSLLNKYSELFKSVLVRDFENKFINSNILLPVKNGSIDFEFMETFIAELEAYLTAAGLKDYELTAEEEEALEKLQTVEWKEYKLTDIFEVKNTKNILAKDIIPNSGDVPYLCASASNNSVNSYVTYKTELLDKGNCIFIGGKTFVVSYQEKDFYSNDSHNLALYVKSNDVIYKNLQLYLVTCVRKSLGHKYSWGDSISKSKIKNDVIILPDISFEEYKADIKCFISAIQKLVIKDVVAYSDRKIAATKQAASK